MYGDVGLGNIQQLQSFVLDIERFVELLLERERILLFTFTFKAEADLIGVDSSAGLPLRRVEDVGDPHLLQVESVPGSRPAHSAQSVSPGRGGNRDVVKRMLVYL